MAVKLLKGLRMKISICVPSYRRPENIQTKKIYHRIKYYVDEKEYEDYKKYNPDEIIISCPLGVQGNVARVRNYIIDNELNENDAVCIIDDDFSGLYYFEKKEKYFVNDSLLRIILKKYSWLCREWGFYFWGVNVNQDKQCYREYSPFSTISYIGAPFGVHLKGTDLRYDERIPLKEDYDFTLQNCNKYRGCLRINKFFYICDQLKLKGGCSLMRNLNKEKQQLELLTKKWGNKIVKYDFNSRSHNTKKEKKIDVNPIIKIPIKGI